MTDDGAPTPEPAPEVPDTPAEPVPEPAPAPAADVSAPALESSPVAEPAAPAEVASDAAPPEIEALEPSPSLPQPEQQPTPPPPTPPPQSSNWSKVDPSRARAGRVKRVEENLEKILRLAQTKESITNDMVEKLLHVSGATATRYLNMLVLRGKLWREGKTRGVKYRGI